MFSIIKLCLFFKLFELTSSMMIRLISYNNLTLADLEILKSNIKHEEVLQKFNQEGIFGLNGVFGTKGVRFYLYKRNQPGNQELLTNDTKTLTDSNFDFREKTKFIVHGWKSQKTSSTVQLIKNAYLNMTDNNIIVVDWGKLAHQLYVISRSIVPYVSIELASFIKFLVRNGVKPRDLHLIGHSLGAHVAGLAGSFYRKHDKLIYGISGLDPAGPLFECAGLNERLDRSDAEHVQIIHTNGLLLGYARPLGHLDFYVNDGFIQPGCGIDIGSCPHHRAVEYFAESILSPVPFTGIECEGYSEIVFKDCKSKENVKQRKRLNMSGLFLNHDEEGIYYLKTASRSPFAGGNPDNWDSIKSITELF